MDGTFCSFEDTTACDTIITDTSALYQWRRWFGPTPTNKTGPPMASDYINAIPGLEDLGFSPVVSGMFSCVVSPYQNIRGI